MLKVKPGIVAIHREKNEFKCLSFLTTSGMDETEVLMRLTKNDSGITMRKFGVCFVDFAKIKTKLDVNL